MMGRGRGASLEMKTAVIQEGEVGRKTKERTKERKELRRLGGRIPALDMVEYICNAGSWEAEAGKPQVPSWPGPHVRKTLSPKTPTSKETHSQIHSSSLHTSVAGRIFTGMACSMLQEPKERATEANCHPTRASS